VCVELRLNIWDVSVRDVAHRLPNCFFLFVYEAAILQKGGAFGDYTYVLCIIMKRILHVQYVRELRYVI